MSTDSTTSPATHVAVGELVTVLLEQIEWGEKNIKLPGLLQGDTGGDHAPWEKISTSAVKFLENVIIDIAGLQVEADSNSDEKVSIEQLAGAFVEEQQFCAATAASLPPPSTDEEKEKAARRAAETAVMFSLVENSIKKVLEKSGCYYTYQSLLEQARQNNPCVNPPPH